MHALEAVRQAVLILCALGFVTAPRGAGDVREAVAGTVTLKIEDALPPGLAVWKTITLGGYANVNALRGALDSDSCGGPERNVVLRARFTHGVRSGSNASCHLGDSAAEIIGRPAFRLSRQKSEIDLVIASVADLGFAADEEVALQDIYARAKAVGLALCPDDAGPQLRLQYLDQPLGEFLHVAMQPIATYAGELTDLTVGNGGAGLLLLGGDGRPEFALPAVTRFVFVRER